MTRQQNGPGILVTHTGFIAAMAANLEFGSYDNPATVGACQSEWIIVSCWGASGDFLSLSHTNAKVTGLGPAPPSLQPTVTYFGILLARSIVGSREETDYLLIRHLPADVTVGGVFHPSDGFARVVRQNADMRLIAHGRCAHCYGMYQEQPIVHDIPDPAPGYEKAWAWHLTADRHPWIGEFTADGAIDGAVAPLGEESHCRCG